jgi:aminoglycoside phosphotransferase (APT) family kinase protein
METIASLQGVDTKRHSDVTNIPLEQLNKWAREYNKQRKNKDKK